MQSGAQDARSSEEEAARRLAEQAGLEYREAHTIAFDPRVLSVVDAAEARSHQALPVQLTITGPLFVLSDPAEERLQAVRAMTGGACTFAVVSESTLAALMNSRLFNGGRRPEQPHEAPAPPAVKPPASPAREAPVAATTAPLPGTPAPAEPLPVEAVDTQSEVEVEESSVSEPVAAAPVVDAPAETALGQDDGEQDDGGQDDGGQDDPVAEMLSQATQPPPPTAVPPRPILFAIDPDVPSAEPPSVLESLLDQVAIGTGNLTAQVRQLNLEVASNRRELAQVRAELDEALRDADRFRVIIETLKDELAKSRALSDTATEKLRQVVGALQAHQTPIPAAESEQDASALDDDAPAEDGAAADDAASLEEGRKIA